MFKKVKILSIIGKSINAGLKRMIIPEKEIDQFKMPLFISKKLQEDLEVIKNLETKFKINKIQNYNIGWDKSSASERVTRIFLGNLKIKNEDLPLITRLDGLELLNLDYNNITNIKLLRGLNSLRQLSLKKNQIKEIKDFDILTSLQDLNLSHNQISKIQGLGKLTKLEDLNLSNNQISKIEGLEKLTKLEKLSLYNNQIKSIKGLNSLENLSKWDLFNNRVMSIEGLENLTSLKKFMIKEDPYEFLHTI